MMKGFRWFVLVLALLMMIPSFAMAEGADVVVDEVAAVEEAVVEEVIEEEVVEEVAEEEYRSPVYATIWALLPPVIAIALALITKEVFSSLFIGILAGGLLYSGGNISRLINSVIGSEGSGGMIAKLADSWNVGILIFLVILGIIVSLINTAGGSAAYGRWASKRISSRKGAGLATMALGVLIFVDDYFNCLTVGSVMRPVTDKHRISRAKLAYLIDSTAAPICIIAPISSWAAAVTGVVDGMNGLELFIRAIPYNFYALLTIVMMIVLIAGRFDYGPMRRHELNAVENGDLYTVENRPFAEEEVVSSKGKVIDLILPVIILIVCCVLGMAYTGGLFSGVPFINSISGCDASLGLAIGSLITLILLFFFYIPRRVVSFRTFMDAIPAGFKNMVAPILILTFAWTLGGMTRDMLGADVFVAGILNGTASGLLKMLPVIVFLIAIGLSFATGTSWGTFGILLPIVVAVLDPASELMIISVSACLAGAVCGDHCSPISDTTIMASTGAQCDHIAHVSTQLPYALTVAAVAAVNYILAGFIQNVYLNLGIAIVSMVVVLLVIRAIANRKKA